MKLLLCNFILVLLSLQVFSQSLAGEWKGTYTSDKEINIVSPIPNLAPKAFSISLKFILNIDSSYSVLSFTNGLKLTTPDTTIVTKVVCHVIGDSVFLQEIEVLLPKVNLQPCFQKMFLKINKRHTELSGTLETTSSNCNESGTIYFLKRK